MLKMILRVDGMMCGMCEAHVSDALRNAFDVKKVKASHSKNRVEFLTEQEISAAELHRVLDPTGYELVEVNCEPAKTSRFGR